MKYAVGIGAVLVVLVVVACSNKDPENCSCAGGPQIVVQARPGAIRAIRPTGPGCNAAGLSSVDPFCPELTGFLSAPAASDCERATLTPSGAGACNIEIDLNDGTVTTRQFTLQAYSGCCGSGFALPTSENGLIDLLAAGGVADAGADGS